MATQWFKFYGGEYLSDTKILSLNANERSCWITLLCLASQTKDGIIHFLSQKQLLLMSGVNEEMDVLKKFEELNMLKASNGTVTVTHWQERQLSESYLRVKEWRMKQKCNADVTTDKNRIDKNRIDKSTEEKDFSSKTANPLISDLIDFLKKELKVEKLDGSEQQNRRYAWLCLRKFSKDAETSLVISKKLISAGLQDKFHAKNMTDLKYLYYNGLKIYQSLRSPNNKEIIV